MRRPQWIKAIGIAAVPGVDSRRETACCHETLSEPQPCNVDLAHRSSNSMLQARIAVVLHHRWWQYLTDDGALNLAREHPDTAAHL